MNSAGSCDSVISMNSGYSEDSMEHLSPEERACLMYLEETIEALEVQEDSGYSNDEPDLREHMRVNDSPGISNESGSFPNHEAPPAEESAIAESPSVNLNPTFEPQDTTNTAELLTVEPLVSPNVPPASLSSDPKTEAALIPPPSDFMDNLDSDLRSEKVKYLPPSVPAITRLGLTVDVEQLRQRAMTPTVNVEQLRQRANARKSSLSPPPDGFHSRSPSDVSSIIGSSSVNSTSPSNRSSPLLSRTSVTPSPPISPFLEPRSPPAVAPKPKIFPANILLKSHKAAEAGSDGSSAPGSERRDHQKVHLEALRKLGLLRSLDDDSGPGWKPKLNPKRNSWAAPSLPVSTAASTHRLLTNSYGRLPQAASSTAPLPEILPAPAAFSDPIKPQDSYRVNDFSPSALISRLPAKSSTLERSGVCLGSYFNGRNSREFGPSNDLSGGQEFSRDYEQDIQVSDAASTDSDVQGFSPAQPTTLYSQDSQDWPRSQGVSVVISPHAENENDRREALKKLGLLRD